MSAQAQRLLAFSEILSATREACRVYMHSVDMALGESLPLPVQLPGVSAIGEAVPSRDFALIAITSGEPWRGGPTTAEEALTFTSALQTAPLQLLPPPVVSIQGWRQWAGCTVRNGATGEERLVLLGARVTDAGQYLGRLDTRPCSPDTGTPLAGQGTPHTLPGTPVDVACLPDGADVAVLCTGPVGERTLLQVLDVFASQVAVEAKDISSECASPVGATPAALAVSADGRHLFLLTCGYALDRASGNAATWLHTYKVDGYTPLCEPVELPGEPASGETVLVPVPGGCWVTTHSPGTDFAQVVRIALSGDKAGIAAEIPVAGVRGELCLAPSPDGEGVAVGADTRLSVWPEGKPVGQPTRFEAPIRALCWTPEGLFVGEGCRIHQVDPSTGRPAVTATLPCGFVSGVVPIPADCVLAPDADADGLTDGEEQRRGTASDNPDTDGDGLADGVDPNPTRPSARIEAPSKVLFRGAAAGREMHVAMIRAIGTDDATAYLSTDTQPLPWLHMYPRAGELPQAFYMGVAPTQYGQPARTVGGMVWARAHTPRGVVAGCPSPIAVRVLPERNKVRRVLWLCGTPEEHTNQEDAFAELRALLASPPLHLSSRQVTGPFLDPFDPYEVVVLDAVAVARGTITRRSLLDFVARGGALLFLGGVVDEAATGILETWLAPMGVHLDGTREVSGTFPSATGDAPVCRHWQDFRIEGGCGVRAVGPNEGLVPEKAGTQDAVFLARNYGYGRAAVLASATPLEGEVLHHEANRRFARDLFGWLAAAGQEIEDLDADGLPDDMEDRNGNGFADPGETNHLLADTDGDGITDGEEDRNKNGVVDEGETNPVNPDSDTDGVFDGTDPTPVPPVDAPHIASVKPSDGPAEGGTHVTITGRSFAPDGLVWFGERLARGTRGLGSEAVEVQAPPCANGEGGTVDVRFENPSTGLEGVLPGGFRYGPRSSVRLALRTRPHATQPRAGAVSVYLESAREVAVGRMALLLRAEPSERVTWKSVEPGIAADIGGRALVSRNAPDGGLWLDISGGQRRMGTGDAGELATVQYIVDEAPEPAECVRVNIVRARVLAPNGEPLDVNLEAPAQNAPPDE